MDIEIVLSVMTAVAGIVGIISGIRKTKEEDSLNHISIDLEEHKKLLSKEFSDEEINSLITRIKSISTSESGNKKKNRETGNATKNFLVYIVPGVVALGLVGLYIYLRASNADNANYVMPEDLSTTMTVLVGYLFGAGAASV